MWFWVLMQMLIQQTAPIAAHEDFWGESTLASVKNWQTARESARDAGLEAALRTLWDTRVAPHLFVGVAAGDVARIQKAMFTRRKNFLIGLSSIQENRLDGGRYTFRALYQLDVAGFLRETKLMLLVETPKTLFLYVNNSDPARTAVILQQALQRPGLTVVFKQEKPATKCPANFCLHASSRKIDEGFEGQLLLERVFLSGGITRATPRSPARDDRKPTIAASTYTVRAYTQEELFLSLPADLLKELGVSPTVAVQILAPGTLDFVSWLQVLFLIQRQEPEVVALRTIGFLSGRNTAVLHVRQAPGGGDVWFKGLYFGKNVKSTWKKRVDGVFELQLETLPVPLEKRPK